MPYNSVWTWSMCTKAIAEGWIARSNKTKWEVQGHHGSENEEVVTDLNTS